MNNLLKKVILKYPGYWFESEFNPLSSMWAVRIAKYPSGRIKGGNQEPNDIHLQVDSSLEVALKGLL